MAFVLTIQGTDTYYTPKGTKDLPDENLSFLFDEIQAQGAVIKRVDRESVARVSRPLLPDLKDISKVLMEGPETLGSDVGDVIARGVLVCLEKMASGERQIDMNAHSRGAVSTILVSNEIQRILDEVAANPSKSLEDILVNSPENNNNTYIKMAMQKLIATEAEAIVRIKRGSLPRSNELDISIFAIDPVPGGSYLGLRYLNRVAWIDDRYYSLPPCVKQYKQIVMRNETTRCFKGIVPMAQRPDLTQVDVDTLPGNHGTASGNLKAQGGQIIADESKDPELYAALKAIPEVTYIKMLLHFGSRGITFINERRSKLELETELRRKLDLIARHQDALEPEFRKYDYGLGREQVIRTPFGSVATPFVTKHDSRIMHYLNRDDTFLGVSPLQPPQGFTNWDHFKILVGDVINGKFQRLFDQSIPLTERIDSFSAFLESIKDLFNYGGVSQQIVNKTFIAMANRFIDYVATMLIDALNVGLDKTAVCLRIKDLLNRFQEKESADDLYQGIYDGVLQEIIKTLQIIIENKYRNFILEQVEEYYGTSDADLAAMLAEQVASLDALRRNIGILVGDSASSEIAGIIFPAARRVADLAATINSCLDRPNGAFELDVQLSTVIEDAFVRTKFRRESAIRDRQRQEREARSKAEDSISEAKITLDQFDAIYRSAQSLRWFVKPGKPLQILSEFVNQRPKGPNVPIPFSEMTKFLCDRIKEASKTDQAQLRETLQFMNAVITLPDAEIRKPLLEIFKYEHLQADTAEAIYHLAILFRASKILNEDSARSTFIARLRT